MQKSSGHPYVCAAVFVSYPEFLPNFKVFKGKGLHRGFYCVFISLFFWFWKHQETPYVDLLPLEELGFFNGIGICVVNLAVFNKKRFWRSKKPSSRGCPCIFHLFNSLIPGEEQVSYPVLDAYSGFFTSIFVFFVFYTGF